MRRILKNRKPVKEPENFCPICGERLEITIHNCPRSVLGSIDAANTRALRSDEHPSYSKFYEPNLDERLKYGFSLLGWNK